MGKIKSENVEFMYNHRYGNDNVYFFKEDKGHVQLRYHVVASSKKEAFSKLLKNEYVTYDYIQ